MTTPTMPELRRALGRALLAAPLAIACRQPVPPADPPLRPTPIPLGRDAGVAYVEPPDADVPPDATPPTKAICARAALRVTGCGGAEVTLADPPSVCGLPEHDTLTTEECASYCAGFEHTDCGTFRNRDDELAVYCLAANPCYGRLPSDGGAGPSPDVRGGPIATHLALARRMEALSVAAFRELAADLARWGAPARLRDGCRRAAHDEARHAAAMTRLLRDRGADLEPVARAAPAGFASLRALALHNEREGAVGETWGALVALYQAEHAHDPDVRAAMRAIADEETAHAALSFEIAAWARTRLDPDDARALDDERRAAFARLRATLGAGPATAAVARLGWPPPAAAAAMLDELAPLLAA